MPLASLQSILQRGHTVDQLEDWQLQEVVASIDRMQKDRKAAAEASKPAGKEQSTHVEGEQKETRKESSSTDPHDTQKAEKEKSAEEAAAAAKALQAHEQPDPAKASCGKPESKDDRRKRLHARNMRYYISLASDLDRFYSRI